MIAKAAIVAASVFQDLVRDALRFAASVLLVLLLPVILIVVVVAMFIAAPFAAFGGGGSQPPPIPLDHLAVMVEVSIGTGVPWSLLAAIASVESAFGANMSTSWAGAFGYGQFMPASWAHWGAGDPYDYRDAIPAMARYLLDHNVLHDIPYAVYRYNHSWEYVALVLGRMAYYQAAFGEQAAALGAPPLALPGVEVLP
jgi:peptidoglycan LD-endopeptidase LytH